MLREHRPVGRGGQHVVMVIVASGGAGTRPLRGRHPGRQVREPVKPPEGRPQPAVPVPGWPAVPVFSKIAVTADPHATVTRAQRDTMSRRVTIS